MQDKKSILLIEPDVNLVEDLQRRFMLEPEFEISGTAVTGMYAIEMLPKIKADIVVIAHPLPDMDVLQLLAQLNSSPNLIKIVTMEVEDPILGTKCIQAGAAYTMTKPYSADKLIEIAKNLIHRNQGASSFGNFGSPNSGPTQQGTFNQFGGQMGTSPGFNQFGQGPTLEQMRNAMNQFAQMQQQSMNYGMPGGGQGMGPMPNQGQYYPGYFQNINPMGGMGYQNPGGFGGFPGGGMPGGSPFGMPNNGIPNNAMPNPMGGMAQNEARGGGYRTLKQKIIAVNCPKGGVGKTSISKELAVAYSMVTVNGQPLRVCLVDADLDFGDIASTLSLNPYPNITHWAEEIAKRLKENPNADIKYSQEYIESKFLISYPKTNLKVLAAPSNHQDALNITDKQFEIILDNLKACDYDVIIIDTGNNTKDYTLLALDKAHVVLMVITMDLTCINDANLLLRTLRNIQFPTSKINLVINRLPKTDKDIDLGEISQVLQSPIIGTIPEFPRIRQLNNNGTPAVLGKDNEYTAAIRKVGNLLVPVFNNRIVSVKGESNTNAPKKSIFDKLFGK